MVTISGANYYTEQVASRIGKMVGCVGVLDLGCYHVAGRSLRFDLMRRIVVYLPETKHVFLLL